MSRPGIASRVRVTLVFLAVMAIGLRGGAEEFPFVHMSPDDPDTPLSSASVQRVFQDSLGYIWIGLYSSGVSRYDGHAMENYGVEDGLADLTVRTITEDREGRLWVGSETGVVVSEEPLADYIGGRRVKFVSTISQVRLPKVRMRANVLLADSQGRVWIGTPGEGIIRFTVDSGGVRGVETLETRLPDERRNRAVTALTERRDGSVWVAINGGTLLVYEEGGVEPEILPGGEFGLPAIDVNVLYEAPDRTLWGGGATGLVWRRTSNDRFETLDLPLNARVFAIQQTDDVVWIATLGSGLLYLPLDEPKKMRVLGLRDGLFGDTSWTILEDREGNLWFGQNGGLSRLRSDYQAFMRLTGTSFGGAPSSLPGNSTFCALPPDEHDDAIWVGTGDGLAVVNPDRSTTTLRVVDGMRSNSVYALERDAMHRVWVGSSEGLNILWQPGMPAWTSGFLARAGDDRQPAVVDRGFRNRRAGLQRSQL